MTTEVNSITIVAGPDGIWYAKFSGPHRADINTDATPTPYNIRTMPRRADVVRIIANLNPDCEVR